MRLMQALISHRGARCGVVVAAGWGLGCLREMLGKRTAIFDVPWQKFMAFWMLLQQVMEWQE